MRDFLISIVVPCYNEEKNVPLFIKELGEVLFDYNYELILVNDGSTDSTQQVIEFFSIQDENVKFISLSRNFGHQKAIKAGVDYSEGDCVVTMDVDLQHPPKVITEMISFWQKGYDVITAV